MIYSRANSKNFGIYQIKNRITNKIYIGSTTTKFSTRKAQHFNLLRKKTHSNKHLQASFNKYKEENFVFEILEICDSVEKVLILEQRYIDSLKPKYNLCRIAGSRRNIKGRKQKSITLKEYYRNNPKLPVIEMKKLIDLRSKGYKTKELMIIFKISKQLFEDILYRPEYRKYHGIEDYYIEKINYKRISGNQYK